MTPFLSREAWSLLGILHRAASGGVTPKAGFQSAYAELQRLGLANGSMITAAGEAALHERLELEPATPVHAGKAAPRTRRWEFIHDGPGWTWRRMGMNDAIEAMSEPFSNFGSLMTNAISSGFSPRQEHWIIEDQGSVTHFSPTGGPVTIMPSGQVLQRRPSGDEAGRPQRDAPVHSNEWRPPASPVSRSGNSDTSAERARLAEETLQTAVLDGFDPLKESADARPGTRGPLTVASALAHYKFEPVQADRTCDWQGGGLVLICHRPEGDSRFRILAASYEARDAAGAARREVEARKDAGSHQALFALIGNVPERSSPALLARIEDAVRGRRLFSPHGSSRN